jgi:hypothetical protein
VGVTTSKRLKPTPDSGSQLVLEEASSNKQLGRTLLDRAENIYVQTKAVRQLASSAMQNPARFGCSVVTLTTGVAKIFSGDLLSGGIVTALGVQELYNQCSSGNSHLQKLLSDIGADVDMVRCLEEGQQQSCKVVAEHLGQISLEVTNLHSQLNQIKNLNTESIKSLEGAKEQAYDKGCKAEQAYSKALGLFNEARDSFGASKEIYQKCAASFKCIKDLTADKNEGTSILEKIDSLVEVADHAYIQCANGKVKLDNADQKFSEAMTALFEAAGLKDQALNMISKAVQSAEDTLKAGLEKTQYTTECDQKIAATKKELQEIQERSEDVMSLLDEMSEEVKKAKVEAAQKLDPSDVILGVGAGVLIAPIGAVSAVAVGVTAAYAWHNGTTVASTTKKVYNYFFGTPLPQPARMGHDEVVRVNLQAKSSGYWGSWVRGRQSFTLGSVDVKLGEGDELSMRLDLNDKKYPICKEDLFTLYSRMFTKLKAGLLTPEHCKKVLENLKKVDISRGGFNPDVTGVIYQSQAANGLVKALYKLCEKLEGQVQA